MHFAALFVVLLVVWVLLSGQFTVMHLSAGVLSSLFVTFIALRKKISEKNGISLRIFPTLFTYWPWLLYKIIMANLDVAYRVWHPRLPISPRYVKAPYTTKTDIGTVTYANSITLTPGTITVSIDGRYLLVHALTRESAEELLDGEMLDRVKNLERHP
jgi:multicomponent Na+:H+ antiporter subunit E